MIRRTEVLAAAARRFWQVGYDQTSMTDVAADVGLGASALYRHFANKSDVLFGILTCAVDDLEASTLEVSEVDPLLRSVGATMLRHREFAALWNRESIHLSPTNRESVERRLGEVLERIAGLVVEHEPKGLSRRLRAQAVRAVLDSPSFHHTTIEFDQFLSLVVEASRRALRAPLMVTESAGERPARDHRAPRMLSSRREALLGAATQLFGDSGFTSVSLDDIGAAVGATGPSIYSHFSSKVQLLERVLRRGNESLWLGLHQALADADGAEDALSRALRSYVDFAVSHPASVSVLLGEVLHLPAGQREECVRAQREYVAEFVVLLCQTQVGLDPERARILIHSALSVANCVARDTVLRRSPTVRSDLAIIAEAVVGLA